MTRPPPLDQPGKEALRKAPSREVPSLNPTPPGLSIPRVRRAIPAGRLGLRHRRERPVIDAGPVAATLPERRRPIVPTVEVMHPAAGQAERLIRQKSEPSRFAAAGLTN